MKMTKFIKEKDKSISISDIKSAIRKYKFSYDPRYTEPVDRIVFSNKYVVRIKKGGIRFKWHEIDRSIYASIEGDSKEIALFALVDRKDFIQFLKWLDKEKGWATEKIKKRIKTYSWTDKPLYLDFDKIRGWIK